MRRVRVVAAIFLGCVFLLPQSASASCAEEPSPEGSPIVFAGTAISERRGYTRFAVEAVHAGPDLAPEVWVRSGQDQPQWPLSLLGGVSSSADAGFTEGEQYVVGAGRSFDTSSCTSAEDDGRYQTATARKPVVSGATGADPPIGPLGQSLWVAGVLAIPLTLVVAFRHRRRNR